MTHHEPLPCPFCGLPPETVQSNVSGRWRLGHRCRVVGFMQIDWRETRDELIGQWNERKERVGD